MRLLKTPASQIAPCLLCGARRPPLEAVYLDHCVHPACKDEMLEKLRAEFPKHSKAQLALMLSVALKQRAEKLEQESVAKPRLVKSE